MRRLLLLSFLALPVYAVDEQPPKVEAYPEAISDRLITFWMRMVTVEWMCAVMI